VVKFCLRCAFGGGERWTDRRLGVVFGHDEQDRDGDVGCVADRTVGGDAQQ
jgi:hypothetical protein